MLKKVRIGNFKCFEEAEVDLSPITIFVGQNGSGKSTVFQALHFVKKFLTNPNQNIETLLNLGYTTLGSYQDIVFAREESRSVNIQVESQEEGADTSYGLTLGSNPRSSLAVTAPFKAEIDVPITLPYASPAINKIPIQIDDKQGVLVWNGIDASFEDTHASQEYEKALSLHSRTITNTRFVPMRRGFYSPNYLQTPPTSSDIASDQEAAAVLSTDADVEEEVTDRTERIFKIPVRAKPLPPNIVVIARTKRKAINLVNEGFGLNQSVYMLVQISLAPPGSTIAVEEPEIHLHPIAQTKLAESFVETMKEDRKQILFTTHSEHMILPLLRMVAGKELGIEDVAVYYFEKTGLRSDVARLEINEKGQLKGGLKGFFEHDLQESMKYIEALSGAS